MGTITDLSRFKNELESKKKQNLLRTPVDIWEKDGKNIWVKGEKLINLSSNDYLGLTSNKELRAEIAEVHNEYAISSTSSRLVTGNEKIIRDCEKYYANYFGYEDSMFFSSGFIANVGIMSALLSDDSTIFYDKHVHASVVTGFELNKAAKIGFKHNDNNHFLKRYTRHHGRENWVVIESLYSMDGETADTDFWKNQQEKVFIIADEAHSFGIIGEKGKGLFGDIADLAVGTFGKAFGYSGAFVLMPKIVRTYMENRCKPYIYTTGISPAQAVTNRVILDKISLMDKERNQVKILSNQLQYLLKENNVSFKGKNHIIAIQIGDEGKAVEIQHKLQQKGFFAFASRFPTVPIRKAILRVSLNPLIEEKDLVTFVNIISNLIKKSV